MSTRFMSTMRLMFELGMHELRSQRRETFLGVVWTAVWPLLQAGGFLIAFNLIRGGNISESILLAYLGVLVWSTSTMMFTSSLSFFSRNAEMIKHLAFPFHLVLITDVNIKFVFFALQLLVAAAIYLVMHSVAEPWFAVASLVVFTVSLYLILVAVCWVGSLLGAVIPDLGMALPPILMLLLALSPIFHPDMRVLPREIAILNMLNPLSQLVVALHNCIGVYGEVRVPWTMALVAAASFALTRFGVRRVYQELAKIV